MALSLWSVWRTVVGVLPSVVRASPRAWLDNVLGLVEVVPDFSFCTDRLATASALSGADDVAAIVAAGVTAVIDCRDDFDDGPLFAGAQLLYFWNPTADDGKPKGPEYWGRSLEFALPLLAQPHHKVLAHCAGGMNRGPSTIYAIMAALSFDPGLAEGLIRRARPLVGLVYKADALAAVKSLGYI